MITEREVHDAKAELEDAIFSHLYNLTILRNAHLCRHEVIESWTDVGIDAGTPDTRFDEHVRRQIKNVEYTLGLVLVKSNKLHQLRRLMKFESSQPIQGAKVVWLRKPMPEK